MVEGLVTVVVPIYNIEKYLDRCVSSIVSQTYTNLEIILVDDGSPDNCPHMCDEWAKRDNRIKVIHKENAGLGMARNTGIENANGEYICFFDGDDYVDPVTIDECYRVAKKESADIVSFGNDKVTQDGRVIERRIPSPPKNLFSGIEVLCLLMPKTLSYDARTGENWNLSLAAWASFYSAKIINETHWRFVSEREIISEDYYSLLKLYRYIEKAVIINKTFYHYTTNPTSLTQTYRSDRYEKLKYFYYQLNDLCDEMGFTTHLNGEPITTFIGLTIGCFKQIVASNDAKTTKLAKLNEIINDPCLQGALEMADCSGDSRSKRLLWYSIKTKRTRLCYLIVNLRNIKGRVKQWLQF